MEAEVGTEKSIKSMADLVIGGQSGRRDEYNLRERGAGPFNPAEYKWSGHHYVLNIQHHKLTG